MASNIRSVKPQIKEGSAWSGVVGKDFIEKLGSDMSLRKEMAQFLSAEWVLESGLMMWGIQGESKQEM